MTEESKRRVTRRGILAVVGVLVVAFALMQLVPYRVSNPAVRQEPTWDSARTRDLAKAACFDCHSNESHPYWWERVAPLSWWITSHVDSGRAALNFSECRRGGGETDDAVETVRERSMPPSYYTRFGLHSKAKLTASERQQLADGLRLSLRGWSCGEGG